MLFGTADPDELLSARAVEMKRLDSEAEPLENVTVLQVLCELDSSGECEMLPPALHPTIPPLVNWQAWSVPESPWGAFTLAMTRIECRSGVRPRTLLTGVYIDNPDAAAALAERWGYGLQPADVVLERRYDEVRCDVELEGESILEIGLRDPVPLGSTDVQYIAALHAAHTDRGLRLVQCDPRHEPERAERGDPIVDHFDASLWGEERMTPAYPVSASVATGRVTLPKLRFVCKADEMAFTGTESV
jgi:hypothetical protein